MIYILNIETATKNCSVSLSENGKTIALKQLAEDQFGHAEKLHLFIKDVLSEGKITLKDLSAICVSKGPGSYTGLRIGVSTAKGLCYALEIPLIAIDTLAILAEKLSVNDGFIVPMIDARRMEVFTQFFNKDRKAVSEVVSMIIEDETNFSEYNQNIHLIGDGALKCKPVLKSDKFIYYDDIVYPSANEMAFLGHQKFIANDFVDVAYFEPFYLKDFMLTTKK